jgi:hypothetical protein
VRDSQGSFTIKFTSLAVIAEDAVVGIKLPDGDIKAVKDVCEWGIDLSVAGQRLLLIDPIESAEYYYIVSLIQSIIVSNSQYLFCLQVIKVTAFTPAIFML